MIVEINPDHPEPRKVRRAVDALLDGAIIAYPTDTVYGLGCDILSKKAIDRLYAVKRMDRAHPLSFICPDLSDIARYAIVENRHYRVLRHFLPGPYTFILEATREVPKIVQTKRKTVGIRVPDHAVTVALARELGRPLISTTAALHGEAPLVDARDIDDTFHGLDLVLDGGGGGTVPTTIVDLTREHAEIVREGAGPITEFVR